MFYKRKPVPHYFLHTKASWFTKGGPYYKCIKTNIHYIIHSKNDLKCV